MPLPRHCDALFITASAMNNFVFQNPVKILFGKGQTDHVGKETAAIGKRILLLTGTGSVKKSGLYGKVLAQLEKEGLYVAELDGVTANPDIEAVRKGTEICKKEKLDAILAVGGGSVIDAAKAIAAGARYQGDPWDFFERKASPENPLPIGVVLTLSATGSEGNGNSVVSNGALNEKRPIYHYALHPRFSILDPTLTFSVSREQTAYGAVDILSHVYEQYFHKAHNSSIQDGFAETLMRTVIESAPIALKEPENYEARANLMWTSTLALNGLLHCGTGGDWASHMIEHELSAHYGIAHGSGLAIIFPAWMNHVYKANPARFKRFAEKVWNVNTKGMSDEQAALAGIDAMTDFYKNTLKIGVTMKDYGIGADKIETMAASAMKFRALGTFKVLSREDIVEIYRMAL